MFILALGHLLLVNCGFTTVTRFVSFGIEPVCICITPLGGDVEIRTLQVGCQISIGGLAQYGMIMSIKGEESEV